MRSSLKARFERLGPIRDMPPASSGSPAAVVLRRLDDRVDDRVDDRGAPARVDAAIALVGGGLSLLRAKRVIEEVITQGRAVVALPHVDDPAGLLGVLRSTGFAAAMLDTAPIDIRQLRRRLGVTRAQFAARYGFEIEALRNWEIGKRQPDTAATSYLRAISHDPESVERAFAPIMAEASPVAMGSMGFDRKPAG
ncbi:putative transcriptional regulator [Acidiphilium rubrum]|uniref:Putative transcriptional regulator n=2 Tax=Acidocellaceae TaxID=3385905 RepID=A0A8G2FDP5_ACIRU|nr:putative transcriptional regulator [Acidiphilium rubrum]